MSHFVAVRSSTAFKIGAISQTEPSTISASQCSRSHILLVFQTEINHEITSLK